MVKIMNVNTYFCGHHLSEQHRNLLKREQGRKCLEKKAAWSCVLFSMGDFHKGSFPFPLFPFYY